MNCIGGEIVSVLVLSVAVSGHVTGADSGL